MKSNILNSLLQLFQFEAEKLHLLDLKYPEFGEGLLNELKEHAILLVEESISNLKKALQDTSKVSKSELLNLLLSTYMKGYGISFIIIHGKSFDGDVCNALEQLEYAKLGFKLLLYDL